MTGEGCTYNHMYGVRSVRGWRSRMMRLRFTRRGRPGWKRVLQNLFGEEILGCHWPYASFGIRYAAKAPSSALLLPSFDSWAKPFGNLFESINKANLSPLGRLTRGGGGPTPWQTSRHSGSIDVTCGWPDRGSSPLHYSATSLPKRRLVPTCCLSFFFKANPGILVGDLNRCTGAAGLFRSVCLSHHEEFTIHRW